jgi:peptidoglycan/LPS O-acetylase OafA/YrhL
MAWASVRLGTNEILRSLLYPSAAFGQLPVGWSLGVEMLFSFLLPAMMLVARRLHWSVLLAGSLLLLARPHASSIQAYYPQYAIDFALGVAVYLERERLGRWLAGMGTAGRYLVLGASAATFGLAVAIPREAFSLTLLVTGLGGAGLLVCAIHVPGFSLALSTAPLAHFGRISYSFYCLHVTALLLCGRIVTRPLGPVEAAAFMTLAFAVTTAAAQLSYHYVERSSIRAGNFVCRRIAALSGRPAVPSRLVSS